MKLYKKLIFWLVVLARLIVLPLFFVYPFLTMLVCMLLDFGDSWVHKLGMNKSQYYKVDKIIDFTMYFVALISSVYEDFFYFLLLVLFIYRQLGYLIQLLSKKNFIYLLFPNFFEFAFLWCFIAKFANISFMGTQFIAILIFIFLLKIIQEFWIYILWPTYTKEHGYPEFLLKLGLCRKDGYL